MLIPSIVVTEYDRESEGFPPTRVFEAIAVCDSGIMVRKDTAIDMENYERFVDKAGFVATLKRNAIMEVITALIDQGLV